MALVLNKLQEYKIPDELFDEAYNNIDPEIKGLIKKSIEINYNFITQVYGQKGESFCIHQYKSFELNNVNKKKSVILYIQENISAVHLISSLLFLKILDIEHIVISNFKSPPHKLLLTLELVGEFDVYNLNEESFLQILSYSEDYFKIFFRNVPKGFYGKDFEILTPPANALIIKDKENRNKKIDKNKILFSHPLINIKEFDFSTALEEKLKKEINDTSVIYSEVKLPPTLLEKINCVVLGPGLELLWVWHNLKEDVLFQKTPMYWLRFGDTPN